MLTASQYLKPWLFCWVRKTSLRWTLVLEVVLSYYVAICYCKRLVILLFQLSLEFERLTEPGTHSRSDENYQLMHQIYWMFNVLCERKNCCKPKYHLPDEKKNPVSFYIKSTMFQISKFSSRFKILILSTITTISKTQLCCHLN